MQFCCQIEKDGADLNFLADQIASIGGRVVNDADLHNHAKAPNNNWAHTARRLRS